MKKILHAQLQLVVDELRLYYSYNTAAFYAVIIIVLSHLLNFYAKMFYSAAVLKSTLLLDYWLLVIDHEYFFTL